jgi:hypothetical protein
MSPTSGFRLTLVASAMAAAPAIVYAAPLTPALVFVDAAPLAKLIMLVLAAATIAAIVVCARKLAAGPALVGGSAFLSSLRLGGPLLGALGASYTLLAMTLGLSNVAETPPMKILAPGFAEAVLMIGMGFCAGAVAAICHWAVEARIDKAVLKA